MTRRRTITAAMARRIILMQMDDGYVHHGSKGLTGGDIIRGVSKFTLLCACGCRKPIKPNDTVIHEHMTPLCMGGADDETNIRLVHKQCADRKTNGTKATSYGSDSHAKAKVDRITGVTGQRKWKRAWPKGRKMEGRNVWNR